ncbi:MAG: alanine racemase [Gaiellaceae bacterium]
MKNAHDIDARSRVAIDLAAVAHNVRTLRELVHPAELWAVVKADGYGHGALRVAQAALEAGASALCVATAAEATELRSSQGSARVLVLGDLSRADHELVRAAGAEVVAGAGPPPRGVAIHLKIDTGMGRGGVRPEDLDAQPSDGVVGVMTHLAGADAATHDEFTELQLERFEQASARFAGLPRHAANSAAALRFPRARYDAVRCGIALYGLSPLADGSDELGLVPALSWHSTVRATKTLRAGESTGYGRRFVAEASTRIGLVPVGYADGFPRALRGAKVLVDGAFCRVVGTPSMDSFTVEMPPSASEGALVTIVGEGLRAEEHARALGTINYEFVCGIANNPARCTWVFHGG